MKTKRGFVLEHMIVGLILITLLGCSSYKIKSLIDKLGDTNPETRENARNELIEIGSPAVSYLSEELAKNENRMIRAGAAFVLGEIKDSTAVESLIAALKDNEEMIRDSAKEALLKIGKPAIIALIVCLKKESYPLSTYAGKILKEIGVSAIKPLISLLGDEDRNVQSAAGFILIEIGKNVVEPLVPVLEADNVDARKNAARILGCIKDLSALKPLISALHDENADVRAEVALALGGLAWSIKEEKKSSLVVDSLIAVLQDENPRVRNYAVIALGRLEDLHAVDPLIASLYDEEKEVRQAAASSLHSIGDTRAVESIITAVEEGRLDLWDIANSRNYAFIIERGKVGTEELLIQSLLNYGTALMASEFYECGNTRLKNAAIKYGELHNLRFSEDDNDSRSSNGPIRILVQSAEFPGIKRKPIQWGAKK